MSNEQLYELVQKDLKSFDDKIEMFRAQILEYGKTNGRILEVLSGNKLNRRDDGLIGDVENLKVQFAEFKDERKKYKWMAAGVVAAAGFFGALFQLLFSFLIK